MGEFGEPPQPVPRLLPEQQGYCAFVHGGYVGAVNVRPRETADQAAAQAFLAQHSSLRVARLGEVVHPLNYPAFIAETADRRAAAGHAHIRAGAGLAAVRDPHPARRRAEARGGDRLDRRGGAAGQAARVQPPVVITTNDNVDALRFYQRRGFCLVRVHRGAVDRSRASLKPEIPRWAPTESRCATRSSSKSNPEV